VNAPGVSEETIPPVRYVRLWLCDPCLDGAGGECHSPGCALWINRAPDIPLRGNEGVTITDTDEGARVIGYLIGERMYAPEDVVIVRESEAAS
jgi:hypothetical protein